MLLCNYLVKDENLEAAYRHVHHARALDFLEKARLELLERIGQSSADLIAADLYPVVYKISVAYKREVFEGEIQVSCEKGRIEGKSFFIQQRLFNAKGKECVCAEVECMLMQGKSKRGVVPPQAFQAAFLSFFSQTGPT